MSETGGASAVYENNLRCEDTYDATHDTTVRKLLVVNGEPGIKVVKAAGVERSGTAGWRCNRSYLNPDEPSVNTEPAP